jgi:hypothetical protein
MDAELQNLRAWSRMGGLTASVVTALIVVLLGLVLVCLAQTW